MSSGKTLAKSKLPDHHKGLEIQASAVAKEYLVATLLNHAHTCIYGCVPAEYFDCMPPTLSEWMCCVASLLATSSCLLVDQSMSTIY